MPKPAYTAVVLKLFDQDFLRGAMSDVLDKGLRETGFVERSNNGVRLSHHMTICMGGCPEVLRDQLGHQKALTIDAWGMTDQALAVRVCSVLPFTAECKNATPHVTVAVNPSQGGSPKSSNDITEWTMFEQPFSLSGILEEVCR